MQFADEELGNVFRIVDVAVDVAGHVDARQRIQAGELVSQRQQHAREQRLAVGERGCLAAQHGAHRAMVEADPGAGRRRIGDVVASGRDFLQQFVEQQHVQRLRQFESRDTDRRREQGRCRHLEQVEQALDGVVVLTCRS